MQFFSLRLEDPICIVLTARNADVIIVGTTSHQEFKKDEQGNKSTYTDVEVENVLKGSPVLSPLIVVEFGTAYSFTFCLPLNEKLLLPLE